jgi:hypothetical protein
MTGSLSDGKGSASASEYDPGAYGRYFDEHVEAGAVHDVVVHDLAAGLAEADPDQADTVVFGARARILVERAFAHHLLGAWASGRSPLR